MVNHLQEGHVTLRSFRKRYLTVQSGFKEFNIQIKSCFTSTEISTMRIPAFTQLSPVRGGWYWGLDLQELCRCTRASITLFFQIPLWFCISRLCIKYRLYACLVWRVSGLQNLCPQALLSLSCKTATPAFSYLSRKQKIHNFFSLLCILICLYSDYFCRQQMY